MIRNYSKKGLMKVISTLLTIALVCGLIPGGIIGPHAKALGEETALSGIKTEFDFRRNAYADNTSVDGRTYTDYTNLRPWAYVSDTFTSSGGTAGTPVALLANYFQLVALQNERLVLKIKIPGAGRYKVNMSYYGYGYAGIMDIYLIPLNEDSLAHPENYITNTYLLDSVDAYQTKAGISERNIKDAVFNSSGEYLLVFRSATKNADSKGYNMLPIKLTFDGLSLKSALINLSKSEIEIGGTATATATGKMSDDTDATGVTVTYSSSNINVATVNESTGEITAVSEGETNITATVLKDGVTQTASTVLTVKPQVPYSGKCYNFEFKKSAVCLLDTTYENTANTWKFAECSSGWTPDRAANRSLYNAAQMQFAGIGSWIALELDIPTAGRYRASLGCRIGYYGAEASLYLMPAAALIKDGLINENQLGKANFYLDGSSGTIFKEEFADVTVPEAGKYYLVFCLNKVGPKAPGNYIYPSYFTLDGNVLDSVSVLLDKSEIEIGATTTATAIGKYKDGSVVTGASVSYSSSNPEVATIDPASGEITAIADGTTNITATFIKDGITKTAVANLSVNPVTEISGESIAYDFRIKAYSGDYDLNGRNYTDYSDVRPWAYVADTFTSSGGSAGTPVALLTNFLQLAAKQNERLVLKIKVPKAGRYRTSLSYYGYNYAGILNIYLIPMSEDAVTNTGNYLTSKYFLASLDSYKSIAGMGECDFDNAFFEEAGEYLLVFSSAGKNASSYGYNMFPAKLIFDGTPLQSVSLKLSDENLGLGEKTTTSVSGVMSSGVTAKLSRAIISYSSSNPSVAGIDAISGEITTLSEGDTDISVTVTLDGVTLSDTKTFHVTDDFTLQSISITGINEITPMSNKQITLIGNLKNGDTFYIPNDAAVFTIIESNPEGAIELLSGGSVAGKSLGTATIKAQVDCRGKRIESSAEVTVRERAESSSIAEYVFTGSSNDVRTITDYSSKCKWAYLNDNITKTKTLINQLATCMQIVSSPNEWVALKIQIPEAGNYRASLKHLGISGGGLMNLYLIPKTKESVENIENYLTDVNLFDQIDGYSASTETLEKTLKDIYVPAAGEYLLVFKSIGKSTGSYANMYPASLLLEGERAFKSVTVTCDSDEIEYGKTMQTEYKAYRVDGSELDLSDGSAEITYWSSNPEIAAVDRFGLITAKIPGNVNISVGITKNDITAEGSKSITVTDNSELLSIELTDVKTLWPGCSKQLTQTAKMSSGYVLNVPSSTMKYTIVSCNPEGAATIDESGLLTAINEGTVTVKATSTFKGKTTETAAITIQIVTSSKTKPTIWTQEMRDAALENSKKYAWAASVVKDAKKEADKYVGQDETLWNLIVPEGLPRYYHVGFKYDPEKCYCRYCGTNLQTQYGGYPFITNALSNPWKIQCPSCKRRFPSNDFGSYYKSGLDEHGIFNKELAQQNGQEYLKNILYPEMGEGWGVDDGFGYFPGRTYSNGVVERHNYIAYYLHEGLWWHIGVIKEAIEHLALAYVYTGEAKYGRTGAIILDRIADFYPDFEWVQWRTFRDDNYRGKILDIVWECQLATSLAKAYDAFFPIYNDQHVISFLSEKAKKYGLENPKNSAEAIRKNAEDGILREIYKGSIDGKLAGNFGMTQAAVASAAIALDKMPETKDWLDWMMRPGTSGQIPVKGGNVLAQFVNVVDRDGMGNEAAPGYNALWLDQILDVAEMLHNYDGYPNADLYKNPKFAKMFTAEIPIIMANYYTVQIGDSGSTANSGITMDRNDNPIIGFRRLGIPKLAQSIYLFNDNSLEGIHEDITVKNPENIKSDIKKVIEKHGTFRLGSEMMTGYGFAVLRDGAKYDSAGINAAVNNQRDFSIYFGRGIGHGHFDCLNLGIDAFGLNMAPDLGYPEQTGTQPNNMQWVRRTLSHNTVMVDGRGQRQMQIHGNPLHFDDSDRVKVMDIDAAEVYDVTSIYRRTLVMVKANDNVSYGVDFFRIRGGDDHIYSFHSQSDEVCETDGLNLIPQVDSNGNYVGTYAGADVPWGPDPLTDIHSASDSLLKYRTGSTWLDEVERDMAPQNSFAVDFKVKDFRRVLNENLNLHLRMTMLNDFPLTEVAVARGKPPENNIKYMPHLDYLLARRTGTDLDTLYTTVYEPYKDNRYIESMTGVTTEIIDGTQSAQDTVKAVKVTFKSDVDNKGRVDYIIYATNNKVKYKIDKLFDFKGFVGVYTLHGKDVIYTYVNDGDTIGESTGNLPEYTGVIEDFTRPLQMENSILISSDQQIDLAALSGKYIYIENKRSPENGVYKILGASLASDNRIKLDLGDVTLVRAYRDSTDINSGYLYNIEVGQKFKIPLPAVKDASPVFKTIENKTVDAKSEISFLINADSPIGRELTYKAVSIPRGASYDTKTQEFRWIPDSSQAGVHHISIEATDGYLSTTKHLNIDVLSATSGSSIIQPPDKPVIIDPPKPSKENFVDLAGYDWAKDAINSLVEAGVIKGTSETTYSPGTNITRADFTTILVRALKLTSDSTDNFADVPAAAYYSNELAAAKNNGIITGIGENKFNPTAQISREDLMVILHRALIKTGYKLEEADDTVLTEFTDASEISGYAKSAVEVLIKNGIVTGSNGKINAKGFASRAETAVLIFRILKSNK